MFPAKKHSLAWNLLIFIVFSLFSPAFGEVYPDAGALSTNAIQLHLNQDNQIMHLARYWPNHSNDSSDIAIRYNQPIVQLLTYDQHTVGSTGTFLLPQKRQFSSEMRFFFKKADDEIEIVPEDSKTEIKVQFSPGYVKEYWVFPSGIEIIRSYDQSSTHPVAIMSFKIMNKSNRRFPGFRLKTSLLNPEISTTFGTMENDDELLADPRHGILYLRDSQLREESWLGIAWAPTSGLITSGNFMLQDYQKRDLHYNYANDLQIILETPAVDLEKGQSMTYEFLVTWGASKTIVTDNIKQLRNKSDYSMSAKRKTIVPKADVVVKSDDVHINYLIRMMKSWAKAGFSYSNGYPTIWPALDTTEAATPKEIIDGIKGFLALGHQSVVKDYINYWLDKRQESPDAAYLIQMIYDYLAYTNDIKWLNENAVRIEELLEYIVTLDDDGDGLPNYRVVFPTQENSMMDEPAYNLQETDLQLFRYSLASILAYRYATELFKMMESKRYWKQIEKYKTLYNTAVNVLEENYWDLQLGHQGGYAFARLDDRDYVLHKQHISMIKAYLEYVGDAEKNSSIFNSCWLNKEWLDEHGYYRSFPAIEKETVEFMQVDEGQYEVHFTNDVIKAGLQTSKTANQAQKSFIEYSRNLCQDPKILAMPGDYGHLPSSMSFSSLSYINVVLENIAGLEIIPGGIRINKVLFDEPIAITIDDLKVQNKLLSFKLSKTNKRVRSSVEINGEKRYFGQLIDLNQVKSDRLMIEVQYGSPDKKKLKSHKKLKTQKRKKK